MIKLRKYCTTAIMTMALAMGMVGCGQSETGTQDVEMTEETVVRTDSNFIKGCDISALEAVEDYGGKFYDFDGNEVDAVEFLMENGCNYFRLRIWNNPTKSFDAGDYCNLEHTLTMAKRIKEAGGKYLLDFHYSDWWADPENQTIPEEWQDLSEEELVQAVYDYTESVLVALEEEGAYPDMVQIGNEIGNGMLWDYGSIDNPETLAALLNSGISAVRDTTPEGQETQIVIHVETGGAVGSTEDFFETIEANGVTDYDIVGLSYYPYWQGTFADMKENIDNIYAKFGKQVVLAETAYPYTNDNADSKSNMVSEADLTEVGFEASEENQKLVLELLMNSVATCDGGLGLFYWEPTWLPVDGAGVSKGSGNEWENQTLFDFDGNALEAITAFAFEPGSLDNDVALYVYPLEGIEIDQSASGDNILKELPQNAEVLYMDGSIREVEIDWDLSSKKEITDTHVAYKGKVLDFDISVGADLVDKYKLNNLDFEDGETGWVETDKKDAGQITNGDSSYPHSGSWSYQYWSADSFEIDLHQSVRIEEDGQYNLQVWSQGVGDTDLLLTIYIEDSEGTVIASTDFTNDGWDVWQNPVVSAELSAGDEVCIGVRIDGGSDDWGTLDEFTFYTGEVQETQQEAGEEKEVETVTTDENSVSGNILANSSLENGENGWTIVRDGTASGTVRNDKEGNPHTGEFSFHYWNESDFTIELSQIVTVKTGGTYTLSAFSQGDEETDTYMTLYLLDADGNEIASTEWSNKGWDAWQNPTCDNIELEAGQEVTVGIVIHGAANGWGTIDDITLSE